MNRGLKLAAATVVLAAIVAGLLALTRASNDRTSAAAGGVPALAASSVARTSAPAGTHAPGAARQFGPVAVNGVFNGVSPEVRSLPTVALRKTGAVENESIRNATQTIKVTDPVLQTEAGKAAAPPTAASFRGLCDIAGVGGCPANLVGCDGCLPPDTNGEAGLTQYVQMVNTNFAVFDKNGAVLKGTTPINALWSNTPNDPCAVNNDGDPVVLYDQLANRWVLTQFIASAPYGECIAVSKTSDALGAYYLYTFATNGVPGVTTDTFFDYPHLGVWPDAYYMTANEFPPGFQLSQGFGAFAFERQKMLNGQPAKMIFFDVGQASPPGSTLFAGALPADMDGIIPPPAGAPGLFAEVDDPANPVPGADVTPFAMRIWKFHADFATPASSTFGNSGLPNYTLGVAPFSKTPCVYGLPNANCIPQKLGAEGLDALNDRLMFRLVYRNFGASPPPNVPANTEVLLANHTVNDASSGVAGIRWYEIRNPFGNAPSNSPGIYQQGTYAPNSDPTHMLWRWMGSIAMDRLGNLALGYSASGPNDFPDIRYSGRLANSPLNVLDQTEAVVPGPPYGGPQNNVESRWGDYSDLTIDPSNDCTFWYTTEYLVSDLIAVGDWQTQIAAFRFPSCSVPTAVAVKRFSTRWVKTGVDVSWRTGSEAAIAGFNVWRATGRGWRRINAAVIPAKRTGTARGASYRFVDRTASRTRFVNYRLQVVGLDGKRSWFGAGSVPTR